MKKFLSLFITALLMIAAVLPALAEDYLDFPVFPETQERSPKRDAGGALTQSDTPSEAFAKEGAEIVSFRFYDDEHVQRNLDNGLSAGEFTVTHYDRPDCKYSCIVMSYHAQNAFEVPFTVKESGLYEFRFDHITDVRGRGAYLQIDDGIYFDAYLEYHWPDEISMYGMFVELTAGEHVMKLYGHETAPTYAQGFAYVLVEAREIVTEPETEPETVTVDIVKPNPTPYPVVTETAPAAAEESASPWGLFALSAVWIAAAISVFAAVMTAVRQKKG